MTKLTDKAFWAILAENGGIYSRTARAIKKKYNLDYSRAAVCQRAERNPERLAQIQAANADVAEEVILGALRSKDERIRVDVAKFYLKTKGKNRGYVERNELTGNDGKDLMKSITFEVIDRREQVRTEGDGDTD